MFFVDKKTLSDSGLSAISKTNEWVKEFVIFLSMCVIVSTKWLVPGVQKKSGQAQSRNLSLYKVLLWYKAQNY